MQEGYSVNIEIKRQENDASHPNMGVSSRRNASPKCYGTTMPCCRRMNLCTRGRRPSLSSSTLRRCRGCPSFKSGTQRLAAYPHSILTAMSSNLVVDRACLLRQQSFNTSKFRMLSCERERKNNVNVTRNRSMHTFKRGRPMHAQGRHEIQFNSLPTPFL